MTNQKLADKMIKEMQAYGLTPDEMPKTEPLRTNRNNGR